MTRLIRYLLSCALALQSAHAGQKVLARVTSVHDGDTVTLSPRGGKPFRARLAVADAPEVAPCMQPHGADARAFLRAVLLDAQVEVEVTGRSWDRVVAIIRRAPRRVAIHRPDSYRREINREMIVAGHAWADPRYDRSGEYRELESIARADRVGLWAAPATPPWQWRRKEGCTHARP